MVTVVDAEINFSCGRIGIEYENLSDAALDRIRPEVEKMLDAEGPEYFNTVDGKKAVDVEVERFKNL